MESTPTLWKLLWDYDPNGLLVLDEQMNIKLVNQSLCRMLKSDAGALLGRKAADILGMFAISSAPMRSASKFLGRSNLIPSSTCMCAR